ncbi:MAG: hypothetical protein P9L88_00845, partial [Candidatus Tantalella remota]|nr:hypothetical protein [Candidatus Tantalella remota]
MSADGEKLKYTNNNNNHSSGVFYAPEEDLLSPIRIIELRSNKTKRMWLKVISFFVSFVFLFQQIGYSDVYRHKRLGGVAEELLPSSGEYDQTNRFAPAYLKRLQSKHEEIVRQRMGKEELIGQLRRKPRGGEVEDAPLKKKRGSGGEGGGKPPEYTLTEPDDIEDPHQYNDLEYEDEALSQIDTFDITKRPDIKIEHWKTTADEKTEDKTGVKYWVGYEDDSGPPESRKIKEVIYFGDKESEKIKKVFSGYVEDPTTGEYVPKFRTEYEYSGEAITKMTKYYIWGTDEDDPNAPVVEESFFEGTGEDNKISKRITYDKNTGNEISRQEFIYGTDSDGKKALEEMRSYDKEDEYDKDGDGIIDAEEDLDNDGKLGEDFDSDGDGDIDDVNGDGLIGTLGSRTYFIGDRDKEVADYTESMSRDGTVTATVISYYEGGQRAEDLKDEEFGYRTPKERVVTYRGSIDTTETDADDDGILDGLENKLSSIAYYSASQRLPGEEVLDYTENYARGKVVQTTVYYYEYEGTEYRADDANYRAPMKKSVTYWGDAVDADGNVVAGAREKSVTYYFIEGRLKGEETSDYTIRRSTRGDIISTTIYYYEGDERAEDSEALDRMSKSVTYRGEVDPTGTDSDGDGVLDGEEKKLASITYYDYADREKGKEVADYTDKYNTRQQIIATTVYLYESDLRRADATGDDDRLSRSVTYRGDVDQTGLDADGDGVIDGHEGDLDSITYYDFETRQKGEEVMDFTDKYNSSGDIATTTVYLYETTLLRAEDADSYDRMSRSVTYRGDIDETGVDADGNGIIDAYEYDGSSLYKVASITYYNLIYSTGEDRAKGEEVMDYTEKFNSRAQVTTTTVYLYESSLSRAEDTGSNDRMSRSVTYRGAVDTTLGDADGDGIIDGYELDVASITYYDYDGRLKGEEVMDYTEKFNSKGNVTQTTVYLYEVGLLRAGAAEAYDRMSRSVTYRGAVDTTLGDADGDGIIDGYELDVASITYYDYDGRLKGEEVMDYTEKFNSKGNVTQTTVYLYEAGLQRAQDADSNDRMSRSVTYRGQVDTSVGDADGDGILDGYETDVASITYYDYDGRLKGEEVMDYTEKFNSRGDITQTTVYLYESTLARAEDAAADDRMSRSVTYRGQVDTTVGDADGDGILDGYETDVASITYYDYDGRLKGEEVMDYTEKFNSRGDVTQTTVYLYESTLERAEDAAADDRMSRSVTYRGQVDTTVGDADGDGILDGYETDVASITYYDYDGRLKGEEVMDYTEKFNSRGDVTQTTVYLYESTLERAEDAASDDRMSRSVTYRGQVDTTVGDADG